MRYDAKIICLKEEADSSSINQAYDKFTAKEDKRIQRKTLPYVRAMEIVVDQWGLVHCGLAAVRHTKENPDIWIKSFRAVNLDPTCSIPFLEWCKKIEGFLHAGDSFKSDGDIDEYLYLPVFWHAMLPDEKKQALDIVNEHHSRWSPSCVLALHTACSIPLADMHLLQTCISLAIANPGHLDRGVPTDEERRSSSRTIQEVEEAETVRNDATVGLNSWTLHPDGLSGLDKFEHMIDFRKKNEKDQNISSSLAIEVSDPLQQALLSNEPMHDKMNALMNNIGNGKKRIGSRVLNALGGIQGHSEILNDPVRMGRMKEKAELMKSMESIRESEAAAEMNKRSADLAEVLPDLPSAIQRFRRGENVTIKLLRGIILACYDVHMPTGKKKAEYESRLKELIEERPFKLDVDWDGFGRTLASQIPAVAAAATPAVATAPSNNGNGQEEVDFSAANDDPALSMASI